jgi:predicted TIM-barrel fold metal-dependent hydrolase
MSNRTQVLKLTPVGWAIAGSSGYLAAYVTLGDTDAPRHVAHLLMSVRKDPDARWRIAAEAVTTPGPRVLNPITASRLVSLLDAAGIRRAAVLSVAYLWGSPGRPVEDEYGKVKAENDWTSQQVAGFPDRLRGFCSFNPLKDYALEELARCAKDPGLRTGLKMHFANSDVDLHNPQHVTQLRRVFRAANDLRLPIVVHIRPSFSRPYGREEARIFLNDVLPAAPDIPIQIAHLAGTGPGYNEPQADQAVGAFAEAIANRDPRTKHLYFDVATNVDLNISVEQAKLVATRIRQLGIERILYGSDAASEGNLPPRQGWAAFRQLPLSQAEFWTIASNVAPYMR